MHKYLINAASILVLIGSSLPAWADWGCGFRYAGLKPGIYGYAYRGSSEKEARKDAMKLCKHGGTKGCHIISCLNNIDTREQAEAVWPSGPRLRTCMKNGKISSAISGVCD